MLFCVTVIIAFLIATVIGRSAGVIGSALKLMDHPDTNGGRKRHVRVTPLVGGLAVAAAALAAIVAVLVLTPDLPGGVVRHLDWLAVAVGAMFALGAADDRFTLTPRTRLIGALLILLPVVLLGNDFALPVVRFTGIDAVAVVPWLAVPFALLCLLALLNAVNMADGKNGVVISLGLIWSVLLMIRLPVVFLPLTGGIATALVVLLFFNMTNRLFLGDGGSYAISAVFGLLSIYAYNHDAALKADDIVLMFAIPIFDTARLIVVRTVQRQSPFEGGRDHLHHFLFARVGWPRGLYIFVALAALPNLGALWLPGTTPFWLVVAAAGYGLVTCWAQEASSPPVVLRAVPGCPVVSIVPPRGERPVRLTDQAPKRAAR